MNVSIYKALIYRCKKIEEKFAEAIEIARTSGISLDKLTGLLTLMYQEDDRE